METLQSEKTKTMKEQMNDILLSISWGELARTYFTKSASWFYHKMDGRDGNKKPTGSMQKNVHNSKAHLWISVTEFDMLRKQ